MKDWTHHPLVIQAEELLRAEGFSTDAVVLPSGTALFVAEDVYSVAAITASDSWHQAAPDIDLLATDFANWALSRSPRDKQWDLYLILLVSTPVIEDEELAEIEELVSDVRYVRRLVRHGVPLDMGCIRTALAPLLTIQLPPRISERDPFKALVAALRSQGVDASRAQETVDRYVERKRAASA